MISMSDNPELIFVDTSILVYAHDTSAGEKYRLAQEQITALWDSGKGCLSLQVLQEFYVTVTRKIARPMPTAVARQIVAELSYWRLHCPGSDDLLKAIDLQQHYQLSFWDAMIVQSAARLGCKTLLSEDLSAGQVIEEVQIVNPFSGN
jgi:predicted nucleic acid-binding protein